MRRSVVVYCSFCRTTAIGFALAIFFRSAHNFFILSFNVHYMGPPIQQGCFSCDHWRRETKVDELYTCCLYKLDLTLGERDVLMCSNLCISALASQSMKWHTS
ncbi:unnamed protein product, partial [Dicrocoelium dendriticum]